MAAGKSWATRSAAAFMALAASAGCAGGTTDGSGPQAGAGRTPSPGASASPVRPSGPPGVLPRPGEVGRIPPPSDGLPPVISSIPTKRKVVFLTIDDGWEQDPGFLAQVRDRRISIAAFVTRDAVEARGATDPTAQGGRFLGAGKWGYMRDLREAGATIENHTLTHPNLPALGYERQRAEICGTSKLIRRHTGSSPTLFRPPFGNHNTLTRKAAKSCGIDALLLWTATVQPGGKIAYQVPDKKLRPGDVLLLHFRPDLSRDFRILVNKIKRRGFEIGNLDAYLKAATR
ncbi:polysaccharide deacetylase family protein [Streptosporangium roseum]|uniref:Xylanase/chitin deacetylase-like protein n=1 Tax=Streptosporangium roseum (strain ATCC 12428 / DSM 43021 / JCM 3005 / KCTC 9067 / NCIMB 10171 / NRRL 2505 / NI 9100) TaxID=479432 RepID=D2B3T3_STRRD|nr:polysaccharide deacetylase family protein [Streptosporangium roseum]ACZ89368.1 xylanase/chitin deacetylase-like protein [Streptosporangium roseum DSM 43021]